jgi:uracil-DNA glycosylase family 4
MPGSAAPKKSSNRKTPRRTVTHLPPVEFFARPDGLWPSDGVIFDRTCTDCPRLARFLADAREEYPQYYNAPVPPFGDPKGRLIIAGLAPGFHGANASSRPFTGDHAGILLYQTLYEFGFASQPKSVSAHDDLRLIDCRINNAVKCVPPENKPLPAEIQTCNRYLKADIDRTPPDSIIVALGSVAHAATLKALGLKVGDYKFAHAAEHRLPTGQTLIDSYHCSRYNTQTRRLTPEMFAAVFRRARALLDAR